MSRTLPERNRRAVELFAPLGPTYDRYSSVLSLGQDPLWRRFLVSRLVVGPSDRVLDVATGTAAVAIELARRTGCAVVGLDQSPEMLATARERVRAAGLDQRIELVLGNAESLPYEDAAFDGLTVTYLLRYVDDVPAALAELARVVRPGATLASLEFGVPPAAATRALWRVYTRLVLPAAGRLISPGWHAVGEFLAGSIEDFYRRHPLDRQLELWRAAGVANVRFRRLTIGGGIVIWGTRA